MKIDIDISIFIRASGSYGHATGTLELPLVPSLGDTMSFVFAASTEAVKPSGFTGLLKVGDRIVDVAGKLNVTLILEDLTLESLKDAEEVAKYLATAFGIITDVH